MKNISMNPQIFREAMGDAIYKLNPRTQIRNPVMFIVCVGAALTTILLVRDIWQQNLENVFFTLQISLWLWFTVLFANFAEAIAEGRGKAQAKALRGTRSQTKAKKLNKDAIQVVDAGSLRKGDTILAEAGDVIPSDGEVIEGIASVDESAVTGESAPVIRESGGDKSSVTGGRKYCRIG